MRTMSIRTKEDVERFNRVFKERNTLIMQDCNAREDFELMGVFLEDSLDNETMKDIYNKVKTLGSSIKMELM